MHIKLNCKLLCISFSIVEADCGKCSPLPYSYPHSLAFYFSLILHVVVFLSLSCMFYSETAVLMSSVVLVFYVNMELWDNKDLKWTDIDGVTE